MNNVQKNRIEGLSLEEKKKLLQEILKERKVQPSAESWPLTTAQQSLFFLNRLNLSDGSYNTGFALNLNFNVDKEALVNSINQIYARHKLLSVKFRQGEAVPECFLEGSSPNLQTIDLKGYSEKEGHAIINTKHKMPFDLEKGPVVRCFLFIRDDHRYVFLFSIHHIVYDNGCTNLLLKELIHFYLESTGHQSPVQVNPSPQSFIHFVNQEKKNLNSESGAENKRFWKREMDKLESIVKLKDYNDSLSPLSNIGDSAEIFIEKALCLKLKTCATSESVTVFSWLFAVYKLVMHS